ncbi:MAG: diguanylate cyclase [Spirochaetes bacterium]|nr:diguanylate cyclase [Spirochaetota bacterium]
MKNIKKIIFIYIFFISIIIVGCNSLVLNEFFIKKELVLSKVYFTFDNVNLYDSENNDEKSKINWEDYTKEIFIKILNERKIFDNKKNFYNDFIILKVYIPSIIFKNPILLIKNLNNDFQIIFKNKIIYKPEGKNSQLNFPIFNFFIRLNKDIPGNYLYIKIDHPSNLYDINIYYGEYENILKNLFYKDSLIFLSGVFFFISGFFIFFLFLIFKLKDSSIFFMLLCFSFGYMGTIVPAFKDIFFNKIDLFIYFYLSSIFYIYLFPFLIIRKLLGLKINLINLYIFFSLVIFIVLNLIYINKYINYLYFLNILLFVLLLNLLVVNFFILIKKYYEDNFYKLIFINFLVFIIGLLFYFIKNWFYNLNYNFIFVFYINLLLTIVNIVFYIIKNYSNSLLDIDTGLFNKYYFEGQLDRNVKLCVRERKPLSLIKLEIQNINEIYLKEGEKKAIDFQKELGNLIKSIIKRSEDYVSICGRGKFYIVLPFTDIDGAKVVVERLSKSIKNNQNIKMGVSFIYPKDINDKNTLIQKADYAVHVAKKENLDYYIRF